MTAETSRSGYSSLTVPATLPPHAGRLPAAVAARGVHQRGREVESAWLRPARRCVATAPWQECGEELAEREQRKAEVCQRKSLANGCRRSSPPKSQVTWTRGRGHPTVFGTRWRLPAIVPPPNRPFSLRLSLRETRKLVSQLREGTFLSRKGNR